MGCDKSWKRGAPEDHERDQPTKINNQIHDRAFTHLIISNKDFWFLQKTKRGKSSLKEADFDGRKNWVLCQQVQQAIKPWS